jgi:hypothetical protein
MKVIYRISDWGNIKEKPDYVTKTGIFYHFYRTFKNYDIIVIADNINDDTYNFLLKYLNPQQIIKTQLGNSPSLLFALQLAINNFHDEDKIYFAEDDYIYTPEAPSIINEGLDISEYCSGYDHPDKYINTLEGGNNKYIINGGELSRVIISQNKHWKKTNSLTMTFAAKIKTLKKDFPIFVKYCSNNLINDFRLFFELGTKHKRTIITSIPAVSTHSETKYLSPFINWELYVNMTNVDLIQ